MKFKDRQQMKKEDVAALFREIADNIEKDNIRFKGTEVTLADSVDVETEYKEKKGGRCKLEIELSWRQGGIASFEVEGESLSEVKRAMKKTFNQVLDSIETDEIPDRGDVGRFIMLVQRFKELSKNVAYIEELESFSALVNDFSEKVVSENLESIRDCADRVMAAKRACHKGHVQK